jgi:hypothetical protein
MNAYESAEYLEAREINNPHLIEIANLLRQQANRIAELEKSIQDGIQSFRVLQEQMLKEKLFGAEPVAWTNQKWLDGIAREPQLFQPLFVHGKQTEHNTIPLYTTPQIKELSDEEINKLWAESHEDGIAMQRGFTTQQHYFAHLILKKAS